jgi:deazaflavin-dependent oxidoreductase (nitroreductase family)
MNPLAGTKFYARLGNRFTRPLWTLLPPPRGFAILSVTGRKTGLIRRWSIRAIRSGQRVYAVCMAGERAEWIKNIRRDPHVTIRLKDGTFDGIAAEVTADERQQAMRAYVDTVVLNDYSDYLVYHWSFPTRARILAAHRSWFDDGIPIVIDLSPRAAS